MGDAKMKILHRRLLLGRAKHRRIFSSSPSAGLPTWRRSGDGFQKQRVSVHRDPPLAGDSSMGPYWTEP